MKKLLLFFSVLTVTTGCSIVDRSCFWSYKIENQTGVEIVVEVSENDDIYETTIGAGDEQTVYEMSGGGCGHSGLTENPSPYAEEQIFGTSGVKIEINKELMPDDILKSKYWDFAILGRHNNYLTYTLTLTSKLLEEMQQQKEE
jgi:hypothetical protein